MVSHKHRLLSLLVIFGAILTLTFIVGCSDDDESNPVTPDPTYSEFGMIYTAAATYLASGTAPTIKAADVYTNLNDGNAANDPFILSIRGATDYAAGHVPGTVNIAWRDIGKAASLALLPDDKQIVVVCYTGHTASQTTMFLNMLGYDAVVMKFGMMSWTIDTLDNPSVKTIKPYDSTLDCGDYPVSTAAVTPGAFTLPEIDSTTSTDTTEIIRAAYDTWLGTGAGATIKASDVYTNLNDGDATNDPLILSVRGGTDYAAGHVTGAINIGWRDIASAVSLAQLPTDKQIVVICYTGHTASMVTALLNMLGYDAKAMKFGMTSWTIDPTDNPSITTVKYYNPDLDCGDYPVD